MLKSKPKRKTRSDKFPLTLHPTGQFCKKIRGKLYYFGKDKQNALQRYLQYASDLHLGTNKSTSFDTSGDITVKDLSNLYLASQSSRVGVGDLSAQYYIDQVRCLRKFVHYIGPSCMISQIESLELQKYCNKLRRIYKSSAGVNLNLAIIKAMFHWAKKHDVVNNIPNIDILRKSRVVHREHFIFTPKQLANLLKKADNQMGAMIWLGINCGFGCKDCSELKWANIDFENKRIRFARKKTGINRNLTLWPETISALQRVPRNKEFVFCTPHGNPWVRVIERTDEQGVVKYSNDNALSKKFSKVLKKSGIKTEKGVGFYTLRRTAATLAARSGDPFAVQKLLGHADLKMASVYVQDVSEQTDRVINNTRKLIIQDNSSPSANSSGGAGE